MSNSKRMKPDDRKDEILKAALVVSEIHGYDKITRAQVAQQANGCAESLVSNYFGTMVEFRRKLMREAIATENLKIIAQGVIVKDVHALKAPLELRQRAVISCI